MQSTVSKYCRNWQETFFWNFIGTILPIVPAWLVPPGQGQTRIKVPFSKLAHQEQYYIRVLLFEISTVLAYYTNASCPNSSQSSPISGVVFSVQNSPTPRSVQSKLIWPIRSLCSDVTTRNGPIKMELSNREEAATFRIGTEAVQSDQNQLFLQRITVLNVPRVHLRPSLIGPLTLEYPSTTAGSIQKYSIETVSLHLQHSFRMTSRKPQKLEARTKNKILKYRFSTESLYRFFAARQLLGQIWIKWGRHSWFFRAKLTVVQSCSSPVIRSCWETAHESIAMQEEPKKWWNSQKWTFANDSETLY